VSTTNKSNIAIDVAQATATADGAHVSFGTDSLVASKPVPDQPARAVGVGLAERAAHRGSAMQVWQNINARISGDKSLHRGCFWGCARRAVATSSQAAQACGVGAQGMRHATKKSFNRRRSEVDETGA
jgi:hypothetical protein